VRSGSLSFSLSLSLCVFCQARSLFVSGVLYEWSRGSRKLRRGVRDVGNKQIKAWTSVPAWLQIYFFPLNFFKFFTWINFVRSSSFFPFFSLSFFFFWVCFWSFVRVWKNAAVIECSSMATTVCCCLSRPVSLWNSHVLQQQQRRICGVSGSWARTSIWTRAWSCCCFLPCFLWG